MKRRLIWVILPVIICMGVFLYWHTNLRLTPAAIEIDESGRIEAEVIHADRDGMTVQLVNHGDIRYSFSAFFILHVKKGDIWYKWREKKNTTHEAVSIEYGVDPGSKNEQEIKWPYWYEKLQPEAVSGGAGRMVRQIRRGESQCRHRV